MIGTFWEKVADLLKAGKLRLENDNVLVKVDADQGDLAKDSLLVTPQTAERAVNRGLWGTVVAVGPGHRPEHKTILRAMRSGDYPCPVRFGPFIPTEVKVGQRVILASQIAGDIWLLPDGEHRCVREAEILAVYESEDAA